MDSTTQIGKKIGEVIEASTTDFTAESYELHSAPSLGALLRTSDGVLDIYAVACHARTASIDPGRRPVARGRDDDDEEEIYRRHPELPQLLRTEFRALVVGFRESEALHHYLPARLHGFGHECEATEVVAFTARLDFLPTLVSASPPVPADELVGAFLRLAGAARAQLGGDARAFLVAAGKELARTLTGDPQRLGALLLRIRV